MKIATYQSSNGAKTGVVATNEIIDLESCGFAADMVKLIQSGIDTESIDAKLAQGNRIPLAGANLLAPVTHPGKVLAIGLNYGDHIEETGMEAPKHQVWFNKQHNCINAPYAPINLPSVSTALDYEAELCVIIGKRCKHVPRERAHEVIAGFCVGNDVSVRDWQMRVPTFQIGKSFDTHGPIGPYLVTPDEVGDPHDLNIRCLVNGEERQSSNTRHLIFDCYDAIAHLTQAFTLDVGDVLFMGTPAGVGVAMKPPVFLTEGDIVRVEVEKLGHIENRVVVENAQTVIE